MTGLIVLWHDRISKLKSNDSNWPYHGRSSRMVTFAWLVTPLLFPPVVLLGPVLPAQRAPGMPHGRFPSRSYPGSHGVPQLLLPSPQQPQWCRSLSHDQNIQLEHLEIPPGISLKKKRKKKKQTYSITQTKSEHIKVKCLVLPNTITGFHWQVSLLQNQHLLCDCVIWYCKIIYHLGAGFESNCSASCCVL